MNTDLHGKTTNRRFRLRIQKRGPLLIEGLTEREWFLAVARPCTAVLTPYSRRAHAVLRTSIKSRLVAKGTVQVICVYLRRARAHLRRSAFPLWLFRPNEDRGDIFAPRRETRKGNS